MAEKENPYNMWKRLNERSAMSNIITKVQLQTKLGRMSYNIQSLRDYIGGFEEIFNRLEGMQSSIA